MTRITNGPFHLTWDMLRGKDDGAQNACVNAIANYVRMYDYPKIHSKKFYTPDYIEYFEAYTYPDQNVDTTHLDALFRRLESSGVTYWYFDYGFFIVNVDEHFYFLKF